MENSKNRFKMMFSIYPLHNQGGKFMKFYGWFLDSGVVPDTALRVFLNIDKQFKKAKFP
jgi:hypothetical protein